MRLFAFFTTLQLIQAQVACPLESFEQLNTTDSGEWINCDGGILQVQIPNCLIIANGINPAEIKIGNKTADSTDKCTGSASDGNLVFENCIHIKPTTDVVNKQLVYETSLFTDVRSNKVIGAISRKYGLDLDFTCTINITEQVDLGENKILTKENHYDMDLGTIEGEFNVTVGVFNASTFLKPVEQAYTFVIPEEVFMQMEINNAGPQYKIIVNYCTAKGDNNLEQTMIDNNCPNAQDDTIEFIQQLPNKTQFKFGSFKFTDLADESPVDIECGVTICDTSAPGADCELNEACTSGTGSRRRRFAQSEIHVSESQVVKTKINVN